MHRYHLARVRHLGRIENAADRAHRTQSVAVEDPGHVVDLVGSYAVLTRDASARGHASRHDLSAGDLNSFGHDGISPVKADIRVEIAVTGMKHVTNRQI